MKKKLLLFLLILFLLLRPPFPPPLLGCQCRGSSGECTFQWYFKLPIRRSFRGGNLYKSTRTDRIPKFESTRFPQRWNRRRCWSTKERVLQPVLRTTVQIFTTKDCLYELWSCHTSSWRQGNHWDWWIHHDIDPTLRLVPTNEAHRKSYRFREKTRIMIFVQNVLTWVKTLWLPYSLVLFPWSLYL